MAKQSGLGDNFYLGGYDLSGDVGSLSRINGGPSTLVVTGIDKSGYERIGARRDGGMEFASFFNDAAGAALTRLKTLPTTDVIATYARGTTLGNQGACCVAKQINYDGSRGDDGSFTFTTALESNGYGVEWGNQLTAGKRSDTTATNGTGYSMGSGSTTFGLQAYLQVFSFTGSSVTVAIQESSDNAGDAYAAVTGGAFTAASGITSERIATATNLTVERYLRVVTTGTFSQATFSVVVCRNETAPAF